MGNQACSPVDTIPDPESVRQRLAAVAREAALLRQLLRLSKRKAEAGERQRAQDGMREAS
jgi:hypothetical protein